MQSKQKAASPLTLNPVANGDSLPFVGPEPHSVAPLKPQSLRGEGNLGTRGKETKKREQYEKNSFDYAGILRDTDGSQRTGKGEISADFGFRHKE
jgi:hypothetical protein